MEHLRELAPLAEFEGMLEAAGITWDELARSYDECDIDELPEPITVAWGEVCRCFKEATRVGRACLELSIAYHDQDDGDAGTDDVCGCFFTVQGVEQLTVPGKRFQDKLEYASWVCWG
jgi:hypothetical protein